MASDWITSGDAAQLSGYHRVHLLRLLRAQLIRAKKFGGVWMVSRSSLLAYVRAAERATDRRRGARHGRG